MRATGGSKIEKTLQVTEVRELVTTLSQITERVGFASRRLRRRTRRMSAAHPCVFSSRPIKKGLTPVGQDPFLTERAGFASRRLWRRTRRMSAAHPCVFFIPPNKKRPHPCGVRPFSNGEGGIRFAAPSASNPQNVCCASMRVLHPAQ